MTGATQRSVAQPASVYLSHFTCNQCSQLLSGTVYRTACDCIFCEDCTWRHFEKSSDCPKCGQTLGEEDFIEVRRSFSCSQSAQNRPEVLCIFMKRDKNTPNCF